MEKMCQKCDQPEFAIGAITYIKSGMISAAHSLTGALELDADSRRMIFEIGMAGMDLGKKLEATLLFLNLIEADPGSAYPYIGLAYCRMMAGNFDEAHHYLGQPAVMESDLRRLGLALRALACHLQNRERDKDEFLADINLEIDDAASSLARILGKVA